MGYDTIVIWSSGHVIQMEHVSYVDHMDNIDDALSSLNHCNNINVNLHSALCKVCHNNESLNLHLLKEGNTVSQLQIEIFAAKETIERLKNELWNEKAKQGGSGVSCMTMQLALHKSAVDIKDMQITSL